MHETLISGHPRDVKKVFIPGAGRLQECKNAEFVRELSKTGFCEGGRKWSCLLTRVTVMRASTVQLFSLGDSGAYREGKMLSQISAVSGSEQ